MKDRKGEKDSMDGGRGGGDDKIRSEDLEGANGMDGVDGGLSKEVLHGCHPSGGTAPGTRRHHPPQDRAPALGDALRLWELFRLESCDVSSLYRGLWRSLLSL
ncbi:MAG: hypothetical protein AMXMBFR4_01820 [Candidatus Hydrogenedentota bacterium]